MNNSLQRITRSDKTNNLFKTAAFISLFAVILLVLIRVLRLKDDGYSVKVFEDFYSLPDNTVDAVFIGSSGVREYYIAAEGYHHRGISVYPLSTSHQPMEAAKYLIKEAEKTQDPKLYLIDIRAMYTSPNSESEIRKVTDAMKPSLNRVKAVNALLDRYETITGNHPDRLSHLLNFFLYHSSWKDLDQGNFSEPKCWLGYSIYDNVDVLPIPDNMNDLTSTEPLDENMQAILEDLLVFCETLSKKVVFTCQPAFYDDEQKRVINEAAKIIRSHGFEYYDLNPLYNEIGLDHEIDMKDPEHVNVYGALKYTDYFSDFLADRFGLPDHRGEEGYEQWNTAYLEMSEELLNGRDVLSRYNMILHRYVDHTVISTIQDTLASAVLIDNGLQRFYAVTQTENDDIYYTGVSNDGTQLSIECSPLSQGGRSVISIDGKAFQSEGARQHFVVYDCDRNHLIDHACFDEEGHRIEPD